MANNQYDQNTVINRRSESVLSTNAVLRNTYMLLGMSLLFSGFTAYLAMAANLPYPGPFITLLGYFGLLFAVHALANSPWGLACVFALTGFMGYTLGPILNLYLAAYVNGGELIMTALGGTGLIFFALSGYVLTTKKDLSFLTGFIIAGAIVGFIAIIASLFLRMPGLQLAISAFFMLFSSLVILWETSNIVNGGQRNYILATITLYAQLFNLFISLLQLLAHFNGNNR